MLIALLIAVVAQTAAQSTRPSIEGTWRSPGGNSIITIADCGTTLCGTVAWASEKAKKDSARTTSQLVGIQLLTGLEKDKKGRWRGKLFIPDKNLRVTAKIERINDGQLKVSGCAMGKSLCKAALWTRVDRPLPEAE